MDAWIGIDPGQKGFLCLIVPNDKIIQYRSNIEKPINISTWLHIINSKYNLKMCVIEDVHSIYGTSAKSNFMFGYNTGLITGIIQTVNLPLAKVQPKKWQKAIGSTCTGNGLKKEIAKIATDLYPNASICGPRGGLMDGKSDSLMIAHYAYLTYK